MSGRVLQWAVTRRDEKLLKRFGGIQTCPWCKQCAQSGEGWSFKPWERDQFLDVLTCGVCGGTSLWRFELGMTWIGSLNPPPPKWPDAPFYSIANARLTPVEPEEETRA